jgi:hypothetical protein
MRSPALGWYELSSASLSHHLIRYLRLHAAKLQIELEEAQERLLQLLQGGAASSEVQTELAMQVS